MKRPNQLTELVDNLIATSTNSGEKNDTRSGADFLSESIARIAGTSGLSDFGLNSSNEGLRGASLDQLLGQLVQVASIGKEQSESLRKNTTVIEGNSGKGSSETSSLEALKGLASVFTGGILPLVSGIFKAFSGGSDTGQIQPLLKFASPAAVQAEAGLKASGNLSLIDRNERGDLRTIGGGTQITVQVQALDSRSFIDRSDDIARAVRDAMLHSSSLNDVVQDL